MQIFLVGGAVRDELLDLAVRERDWVVVGAKTGELEKQGYKKVGKHFPVFLHPQSKEEYALARTEIKTGKGYHGFEFHADSGVTLEEDLHRRDLTINAIAQDANGELIDPYGGQADIEARVLRHVSEAFREDPVRVLRVARFAARFHSLGFTVAAETIDLMKDMVSSGEVESLVPERVWTETQRALAESRPDVFFQVLRDCHALAVIFPEVDALFGIPQPARWHPEIDTGIHVLLSLRQAAVRSISTEARFAVLVHDLGKATTPEHELPHHKGHEYRSVKLVQQLCRRLNVPNRYRDLAIHVARYHTHCHLALELRPETILKMLDAVDAFRRPERFEDLLAAAEVDAQGRKDCQDNAYPQADLLRAAKEAAAPVNAASIGNATEGMKPDGKALGKAIREARIAAIKKAIAAFKTPDTAG